VEIILASHTRLHCGSIPHTSPIKVVDMATSREDAKVILKVKEKKQLSKQQLEELKKAASKSSFEKLKGL
jgi:ribosomal protein L16/L10AE